MIGSLGEDKDPGLSGVLEVRRWGTIALIAMGVGGSLVAAPGCGANTPKSSSPSSRSGDAGSPSSTSHPAPPPGEIAPTDAQPAKAVAAPAGFSFTTAPDFSEPVKYVANRSSVMLFLPFVDGARDYRVYALVDGVSTQIAGDTEDVTGATITCAGLRQHNMCDDTEAIKEYGHGDDRGFYVPSCDEDVRAINVPPTVLRQIEVNGLSGDTVLAVEAIDSLCPFPGAIGNAHFDVPIFQADKPIPGTYAGKAGQFPPSQATFPIRTEDEIRTQYKSLILNGHGHASRPTDPLKGPFYNLAQPAPPVQPKVLGRAIITVSPAGTTKRPDGYKDTDIFDDFSDDTDAFTLVKARNGVEGVILPQGFGPIGDVKLLENSKWDLYTFNGAASQVYVAKGELHTVMADEGQDVMGSNVIYPKRPVQIPNDDNSFLHVTFETQTDATQRRYWWFHLCGAETAGQTYVGTALPPTTAIVALPFFMNPASGPTISMAGWNCMQFVPRGGDYDVIPGGQFHNPKLGGAARPETDVRILVNRPTPAGGDPTTDDNSVILLDPSMNPGNTQKVGGSWMRTWDASHNINGVLLDDEMFIGQRTHLDFFINRSRVVMFVNGVQKACDNFGAHKLTMAEAAVGIGHVIYHSSAERTELMLPDWIRTGQNYYRWNTPFVDVRSFDNVGIQEGVGLPSTFDAAPCFTTPAN